MLKVSKIEVPISQCRFKSVSMITSITANQDSCVHVIRYDVSKFSVVQNNMSSHVYPHLTSTPSYFRWKSQPFPFPLPLVSYQGDHIFSNYDDVELSDVIEIKPADDNSQKLSKFTCDLGEVCGHGGRCHDKGGVASCFCGGVFQGPRCQATKVCFYDNKQSKNRKRKENRVDDGEGVVLEGVYLSREFHLSFTFKSHKPEGLLFWQGFNNKKDNNNNKRTKTFIELELKSGLLVLMVGGGGRVVMERVVHDALWHRVDVLLRHQVNHGFYPKFLFYIIIIVIAIFITIIRPLSLTHPHYSTCI